MVKQSEAIAHSSLVGGSEITLHTHAGGAGVPTGVIAMWSGLKANIPATWYLCDGTNGTPDLRDKFICSIGASGEPGGTGGSTTLTHAGSAVGNHAAQSHSTPALVHSVTQPSAHSDHAALTHSVTQPSDHTNAKPPYYTLAFIMKGAS